MTEAYSLPVLQDQIKRNPEAYADEFEARYAALQTQLELFEQSPQKPNKAFTELVMHVAHVSHLFGRNEDFGKLLIRLLKSYATVARPLHLRTLVAALTLMDNSKKLDKENLYAAFVDLLDTESDEIPKLILKHLIKGFKSITDIATTRKWQRTIFSLFKSSKSDLLVRRLHFLMISLYLNGHWKDQATANAIAEGLWARCSAVIESAARFILGDVKRLHISTVERDGGQEVDEEEAKRKQAEMIASISKELSAGSNLKKKKSQKKIERMKEQAEKHMAKLEEKSDARVGLTFEIMDQLYDPHKTAEAVFAKCQKDHKHITFKIRLLLFTVAARLMGKYNVSLPGFFSFFTKYVKPSQDQVTRILAVLAQAVHESVNPSELQQCTKLIADQFVVEASPPQIIAIGINTIREMCHRNVHSVTPELLSDLVDYCKEGRETSVRIAASSLRNLYRLKMPEMLPKKHRGKAAETYGQSAGEETSAIEGLDILVKLRELLSSRKRKHQELTHDDEEELEAVRNLQTSRVLTPADFAALKKIKVKQMTAKSMGLNLRQWLDKNEDTWHDLAQSILGPSPKKRKVSADEDQDTTADGESGSEDDEEIDEGELAEMALGEEDALSEPSDDDEEESADERETVITGRSLEGRSKKSRAEARVLAQQQRKIKRQEQKDRRQGGKETNRAGITNRTQSRNKPMAMLRQKRQNKDKAIRDARDKVANLKAHIKTLKTATRQKLRRK